jgi:hypothetical protein
MAEQWHESGIAYTKDKIGIGKLFIIDNAPGWTMLQVLELFSTKLLCFKYDC